MLPLQVSLPYILVVPYSSIPNLESSPLEEAMLPLVQPHQAKSHLSSTPQTPPHPLHVIHSLAHTRPLLCPEDFGLPILPSRCPRTGLPLSCPYPTANPFIILPHHRLSPVGFRPIPPLHRNRPKQSLGQRPRSLPPNIPDPLFPPSPPRLCRPPSFRG